MYIFESGTTPCISDLCASFVLHPKQKLDHNPSHPLTEPARKFLWGVRCALLKLSGKGPFQSLHLPTFCDLDTEMWQNPPKTFCFLFELAAR